jgi:hypothetical protein
MAVPCCAVPGASQQRSQLHDRSGLWLSVALLFLMTVGLLILVLADTQFVQDRIDTAFRLIANSITELRRSPLNPNIAAWHDTLFGHPPSSEYGNIQTRFEALSRISQLNNVDQTRIAPDGTLTIDVRFYCTVKRIGKRTVIDPAGKEQSEYANKDRGIGYRAGSLDRPGGRFGNCFDVKEPTLMVTLNPADLGKFSEIQICPWYLKNARGFRFRDLADVPSSLFASVSKWKLPSEAKKNYTPLDMFVLTDKIIVHELTHTDQARPGTSDMDPTPYGESTPHSLNNLPKWHADAPFSFLLKASRMRRTLFQSIETTKGGRLTRCGTQTRMRCLRLGHGSLSNLASDLLPETAPLPSRRPPRKLESKSCRNGMLIYYML